MKRILVTGGAQGIGRAIVGMLLADEMIHVTVIDKQTTAYVEQCQQLYAKRFTFILQDIAERQTLASVLEHIGQHPIHGVINNAGEVYLEKWNMLKLETWDRTIAVNLTAPLQIVHGLRDALTEDSAIVNIASADGYNAAFDTIAYAASKAGLMNLTKSLAAVLGGQGIRVNAIAPGWVETEMTKGTLPEESVIMTPLRRNATAADVASVACFLLSAQSSFIQGETITVDGGLSVVDYTLKKESEYFADPSA